MVSFTALKIQDIGFKENLKDINNFYEKDKFRNWYLGNSSISIPYISTYNQKFYRIDTFATSGEISTPLFREPFDKNRLGKSIKYAVFVHVPNYSYQYNPVSNLSRIFDIEQDLITQITGGWDRTYFHSSVLELLDNQENRFVKEEIPFDLFYLVFDRFLTELDFSKLKRKSMPGMRTQWHYNGTVELGRDFRRENRNFVRLANIVHSVENHQTVWAAVKAVRLDWVIAGGEMAFSGCGFNMAPQLEVSRQLDQIEQRLQTQVRLETVDVTDEELSEAAEMYIYIINCPDSSWTQWINFYSALFLTHTPRSIITTLSRLIIQTKDHGEGPEFELAFTLAKKFAEVSDLALNYLALLTRPYSQLAESDFLLKLLENISICFNTTETTDGCQFMHSLSKFFFQREMSKPFVLRFSVRARSDQPPGTYHPGKWRLRPFSFNSLL